MRQFAPPGGHSNDIITFFYLPPYHTLFVLRYKANHKLFIYLSLIYCSFSVNSDWSSFSLSLSLRIKNKNVASNNQSDHKQVHSKLNLDT